MPFYPLYAFFLIILIINQKYTNKIPQKVLILILKWQKDTLFMNISVKTQEFIVIGHLRRYFRLDELQTNFKTEILAGATTFFTMVIVVNPKILQAAGIPFGPSMVATILSAFFGTIIMGIYARRPFAIAPYMGENAFIAYTVVQVLGYSWQTALGAIFIGGVLFMIISLLGIRSWLARSIPDSLKIAFAVGIGLFLTFIGLIETGIVSEISRLFWPLSAFF